MSRSLIITEGIDDVRALRGLYQRVFGFQRFAADQGRFQGRSEVLRHESSNTIIELVNGRDKLRAAQTVHNLLREGPEDTVARAGLVIDPDEDSDAELTNFIEKNALGDLVRHPEGDRGQHRVDGEFGSIEFLATCWESTTAFHALPAELRNLERVGIGLLQAGRPDDAALVRSCLEVLHQGGRTPSWKTAFRLFNAIVAPATEDGFVDRVFGQDRKVRKALVPTLGATRILGDLAWLAQQATPTQ